MAREGRTGGGSGPPRRVERDRDPTGRARNARPRDSTGRPLPRGAAGVPQLPDDLPRLPPADALAEADRLLAADAPFAAHEVLEAAWKAAPEPERDLWRGLAQVAVGLTHAQRGNPSGAATLLRRGAVRLAPYAADPPYGVDVQGVRAGAGRLADAVSGTGLAALDPADLRLRLRLPD